MELPELPGWVLDTIDLLLPPERRNFVHMISSYWISGEQIPAVGNERYAWPAIRIWLDKEKKRKEPQSIRNSPEYREWRMKVYKRDGFRCQLCGKTGGTLNAHHIKRFTDCPEERLNVDNGITLCIDCHHAVHRGDLVIDEEDNKWQE